MGKRSNTKLKARGNKRVDRKKGAGLTTTKESPSTKHKNNGIKEILGIETDVTIRNGDLNDEIGI